ncbi:MAG: FAD binding domain-containing protein [Bacilli bacterium]|nr:FAD binding domain-containing protein [Bacilli bacterium]
MVNKYIPTSTHEALDILSKHDCYILAGGSDLMVVKKNVAGALPKFDKDVLYVSHIEEMKGIYKDEKGLHIKAGTTMDEVEHSELVPTLLRKAVSELASTNIRHFATLVGNIANASPAGDTIVVDVVLDAVLKLESVEGERFVKAEDFVLGVRKIDRKPNELITEIIFPEVDYNGELWFKVGSRKADSISKVMMAGIYKICRKTLENFALVFGSVSIKPVRSHELENELKGMSFDDVLKNKKYIVEEYAKLIKPIDDQRSTAEYRLTVAKNMIGKFIDQIVKGDK